MNGLTADESDGPPTRMNPDELGALEIVIEQALSSLSSLSPCCASALRLEASRADEVTALAQAVVLALPHADGVVQASSLVRQGSLRDAALCVQVLLLILSEIGAALFPEELVHALYKAADTSDTERGVAHAAAAEAAYAALSRHACEGEAAAAVRLMAVVDAMARLPSDTPAEWLAEVNSAWSTLLGPSPSQIASLILTAAEWRQAEAQRAVHGKRWWPWRRANCPADISHVEASAAETRVVHAPAPSAPSAANGHRALREGQQRGSPTELAQRQQTSAQQPPQPGRTHAPLEPQPQAQAVEGGPAVEAGAAGAAGEASTEDAALLQAIANSLLASDEVQHEGSDILSEIQARHDEMEGATPTRTLDRPAGLLNLGNTCYISCLLQIYYHLPCLRAQILELPLSPDEIHQLLLPQHAASGETASPKVDAAAQPALLTNDQSSARASNPQSGSAASEAFTDDAAGSATAVSTLTTAGNVALTSSAEDAAPPTHQQQQQQQQQLNSDALSPARADAASADGRRQRNCRFLCQLQLLFARLALSVKQSVSPGALLQELFADSHFVMGVEADASEVNKLLLDRLEAALLQLPDASRAMRSLLYGEMSATILASEADGTPITLRSTEPFSEIILPVADAGSEIHQAMAEVMHTDLSGYQTPRGHTTRAVKELRFRSLPELLSIQLQRVTYDAANQRAVKSDAAFAFGMYLDLAAHCESAHVLGTGSSEAVDAAAGQGVGEQQKGGLAQAPKKGVSCGGSGGRTACDGLGAGGTMQCSGQRSSGDKIAASVAPSSCAQSCSSSTDAASSGEGVNGRGGLTRTRYELHALLLHIGDVMGGHYQVVVRGCGRKWHILSDCNASDVDEETVLSYGSGSRLDPRKGTPYCLFYALSSGDEHVTHDDEAASCDVDQAAGARTLAGAIGRLVPAHLRARVLRENEEFLERKRKYEAAEAAAAAAAASQQRLLEESGACSRSETAAASEEAATRLGISAEWLSRALQARHGGRVGVLAVRAVLAAKEATHTLLLLHVRYADGRGDMPERIMLKVMPRSPSLSRELFCYELLSAQLHTHGTTGRDMAASSAACPTGSVTSAAVLHAGSAGASNSLVNPASRHRLTGTDAQMVPSACAEQCACAASSPLWIDIDDPRAAAGAESLSVAATAVQPKAEPPSHLRVPRFFGSASCGEGRVALLLEYVPQPKLGDQLVGASEAQARASLRSLAVLHAKFWGTTNTPEFKALPFSPVLARECATAAQRLKLSHDYSRCWPSFAPAFRTHAQVPAAALQTGELLTKQLVPLLDAFCAAPVTLLHGDCRVTNFIYAAAGAPTLIDFEYASRGRGAMDVATFMCGSLRVDARRLLDMDMLMEYHATLLAHGIRGYTFEALVSDYRLALLLCLVMPVLSSPDWLRLHTAGLLHRGSTIGERFELACAVVHRITSAVADLHNGGIAK